MSADDLRNALRALPPVRPPQGARERVWARAAAPTAPSLRSVIAIGVLVAAAVAAFALLPPQERTDQARALQIAWSDAPGAGRPLEPGARIATAEREALLGDGATVLAWLARGARARVVREGDRVIVALEHGEVRVWAAPRSRRQALEIVTPRSRVRVVGTLFTVRTSAQGDAVWVGHGAVEVLGPEGDAASVGPGEQWARGEETPAVLPPAMAQWIDARAVEGTEALRGAWTAPLVSQGKSGAGPLPGAVRPRSDGPAGAPEPLREVAPPPEEAGATARSGDTTPPPQGNAPRHVESRPDRTAPAAGAAAPSDPGEAGARAAMELERAGEVVEALAAYRSLAEGSGSTAELALYSAGRLQLRRLGDLPGALATWEECVTRFPSGTLRQEVDLSILDALVRAGRTTEAAAAADAFLARWPSSERRAEVQSIRDGVAGQE